MPVTLPASFEQQHPDSSVLSIGEAQQLATDEEAKRAVLFDYDKYEGVLDFITDQMNTNAKSSIVTEIRDLNQQASEALEEASDTLNVFLDPSPEKLAPAAAASARAHVLFYSVEGFNAEWDFKNNETLNFRDKFIETEKVGGGAAPVTPIRGDAHFLYYYDIWGNIHYGFIGIAAGFSREWLLDVNAATEPIAERARNLMKGKFSIDRSDAVLASRADDETSVKVGLELAEMYGSSVSREQVHSAIYNARNSWTLGNVRLLPENLKPKALQGKTTAMSTE